MNLLNPLRIGEPGHAQNWKRVSGSGWFTRDGAAVAVCLGDVVLHKFAPTMSAKTVKRATRYGTIRVAAERTIEHSQALELELAEFTPDTLQILLGADAAVETSDATDYVTRTFTNAQPGTWLDLGATNLLVATVRIGSVVKREGFDYVLDLGAGKIFLREGATIPSGATVTVSCQPQAGQWRSFASGTLPDATGVLQIVEYDQFSDQPLAIYTLPCSLRPSDQPSMGTDDVSGFTFTATATGQLTVQHRKASAAEYLITLTTELMTTLSGEPMTLIDHTPQFLRTQYGEPMTTLSGEPLAA